jgi:hypothetical protein
MKSPHEPDGPRDEEIFSEVAAAFREVPRRLEPPAGTYETLRRRAAGRRRRRGLAVVALACCAAAGVLGSVSTRSGEEVVRTRDVAGSPHVPSRTPTPREEHSVRPAPGRSTHTGRPAAPSSSGTPGRSTGPTRSPAAPPPPHTDSSAVSACASDRLRLTAGRGAGAAGSVELPLMLTNTGAQACTLHGFPGVSLVGADGAQLGSPATRTGARGATVVLAPGHSARADVRLTRAENYPQERCAPAPATGLRVYPPNQTEALFLPRDGLTGCTSVNVTLLSVKSVRAAG